MQHKVATQRKSYARVLVSSLRGRLRRIARLRFATRSGQAAQEVAPLRSIQLQQHSTADSLMAIELSDRSCLMRLHGRRDGPDEPESLPFPLNLRCSSLLERRKVHNTSVPCATRQSSARIRTHSQIVRKVGNF